MRHRPAPVLHFALTLSLTWALAGAATPPVVDAQFQELSTALRACPDVPGPMSVRAGLVLWPDGAWGVALTDWRAVDPIVEGRARACLDAWLQQHTRERLDVRLRSPGNFHRTLTVPTPAELVAQRLDAELSNVQRCKRKLMPPLGETVSARVQVTVQRDGTVLLSALDTRPPHPMSSALVDCTRQVLSTFAGLPLDEPLVLERQLSISRKRLALPNSRGNVGDLCGVGEWRRNVNPYDVDEILEPAPCKPGLSCCHGGAAGSDSTCWNGPTCPMLP